MKKIDKETLFGGIFGLISIIAVFAEMALGEFSSESIAGGIKDISGTIVAVLVLYTAWRALHPKTNKDFNFEERLDEKLILWQRDHSNMVFFKDKRDLHMKTDIANFFTAGSSKAAGRFIKIDVDSSVKLTFSLNRSLFVGHGENESIGMQMVDDIGKQIFTYISSIFSENADINYEKAKTNIVVKCKLPENDQEIDRIIEIMNTVYQAFLVCASTNK